MEKAFEGTGLEIPTSVIQNCPSGDNLFLLLRVGGGLGREIERD